jgi:dienelactone hydrolase
MDPDMSTVANRFTSQGLVHSLPGADAVTVERGHTYPSARGPLGFDLYRPVDPRAPSPAVIFVTGMPDPGAAAFFGAPFKDWASYIGWARLAAASGIAGITYLNRDPADVAALVAHLRANAGALGIDPDRIGIWACSGHMPNALALFAREPLACAALLYGYALDLDGSTTVADAAAKLYFAAPAVSLDELPRDRPMLVARAGRDQTPGLDANLSRFVEAARERQLPVTLIEHAEGPHAFDLVDDSPRTREVIEEVLAFLRRSLGAGAHG